jgi:hypothetical protein
MNRLSAFFKGRDTHLGTIYWPFSRTLLRQTEPRRSSGTPAVWRKT